MFITFYDLQNGKWGRKDTNTYNLNLLDQRGQ